MTNCISVEGICPQGSGLMLESLTWVANRDRGAMTAIAKQIIRS